MRSMSTTGTSTATQAVTTLDEQTTPAADSAERPLTNRNPLSLVLYLVVVAIAVGAVAIGGWWFGSSLYGMTPNLWI